MTPNTHTYEVSGMTCAHCVGAAVEEAGYELVAADAGVRNG